MNTNPPCGVCVLHAVRTGVDFTTVPPDELIGQQLSDGTQIHGAVTVFAGTPVCWYHVDDAAKSVGM